MKKGTEEREIALKAVQEKIPNSLFVEPVDFIFADHFRQRTLCGLLDEIAKDETYDAVMIETVQNFMKSEFKLHILDEEEDLFPLLKGRAEPEDEINVTLGQLSEEHVADETDAKEIKKVLQEMLETGDKYVLDDNTVQLLTRFAANERQHLIVENAIILPLARVRLTQEDKKEMGQRMAARRGVVLSD